MTQKVETQRVENEERLARPLIRLARLLGVATSYIGQTSDYHEIDDDVLVAVLNALGVDASSDEAIATSTKAVLDERHRRLVNPTVLHTVGKESSIPVNTGILEVPSASITLEQGKAYEGKVRIGPGDGSQAYSLDGSFVATASILIPADLPMGYHTLHVAVGERTQDATLISAPEKVRAIKPLEDGQLWGWMAQLYSIRSTKSWGVGDFNDLKALLIDAKHKTGADFVLVNPLHAAEPVSPLTPSPYLPVSRSFVNFTYIRPEDIEEYDSLDDKTRARVEELRDQVEPLNGDAQLIDRDAMWRAKMRALWLIFKAERSAVRQTRFEWFKQDMGDELEAYATWCLCYDKWGAPNDNPENWVHALNKDSPEVAQIREQFPDTLDFYRWLEWIAIAQLQEAQRAARSAGMRIGIMSDMAVGVHPAGSEVWWEPRRFAQGATVGAPPDYFNQQGQDWSQPPLNPIALDDTGYKAYRDMVHGMLSQAGAVRIDHILGLFRLWWIPQGHSAVQGAYVHYDSEIMTGVLAIEAERAHGVIVGEDLGVVPQAVEDSLERHGILGCAVEWFEQRDGVFRAPDAWRRDALASVNTHDLPPAAGYLSYEHVDIRQRLGLLTVPLEEFKAQAVQEHNAMLSMLIKNGFLDPAVLGDGQSNEQQIVEALYRALRAAPSRLLAASLADAVGERRAQNQPGTDNEYPNWRIPLADENGSVVPLEALFDNPRLQSLAAIMRG
ncbi:4-alpha-glucanotransferase [Bifidobacterium sp.]|jgi:4-alpha-glucanotransferase|uniref:4-alpha-glucanotransferase n=1 Tax=Bifidobacterium sp. TaxID=41200 RepID=UPI0025BC99C9|nr:4-alpha-glucanotransferase [Bifidobacterium sp.]MCH4209022.1 4-alpha-glucanotransferase [Bifidobacterium sp.]MCI1225047.1 4-alpha-glucanotransferase [Bifidobacterium sp.]